MQLLSVGRDAAEAFTSSVKYVFMCLFMMLLVHVVFCVLGAQTCVVLFPTGSKQHCAGSGGRS